MERYELPDGWMWTELARVAKIGAEQVLPSKHPSQLFNYLALENIEQGSGKVVNFSPTRGGDIKSNKFKFTNRHVLYGKLRPYLRKAIAPEFEGISATDLLPLLPEDGVLDRHFLVLWLLSPQILEYVVAKQAGVKMPRLRSKDLGQMPLPLPPFPEQQCIVAKIESLFEQSQAARDALARIPQRMAQFRRAVLASAFRGGLVEHDPNDEPAASLLERVRAERRCKWEEGLRVKGKDPARYTYHEPEPPDTSELPELPEAWIWVELGELLSFVGSGSTPKGGQKVYKTSGIPFIRSQNVYPNGLRLDDIAYISEQIHTAMARTYIQPRDVLLNITGASIGRSTIVPKNFGPANVNQHVCIIRLVPEIEPQYLSRFLNSLIGQAQIMESQSGVTRQGLNYSQLRKIIIPFAPIAEQRRIVAKIESLFAQAETIEHAASLALRRAGQIDQSILARAFRGELVQQDPDGKAAGRW
jgi:type I restriction enzyme S subunit